MNVSVNGHISFACSNCDKKYSIESQTLPFEPDISPEAGEAPYIRYQAGIQILCSSCNGELAIKLDVWEHPSAVTNYSYYDDIGIKDIQCEFHVEHYFDDRAVKEEDLQYDEEPDNENEESSDNEGDDEMLDFDSNLDPYDEDDA